MNKLIKMFTQKQRKAAEAEKRRNFDDLMRRRYFFSQGFEIYGGVAGLYDYGPPGEGTIESEKTNMLGLCLLLFVGCAVKNNLLKLWRDHFILEEDMLEISTTCITPVSVFKASVRTGHTLTLCDLQFDLPFLLLLLLK